MGNPHQKNSAVYILQTVIASAGSARCIVLLFSGYVFFRPGAISRHAVGGMKGTAYAGPLPEKIRKNPHTGIFLHRIKNTVLLSHLRPCMRGKQKKPL